MYTVPRTVPTSHSHLIGQTAAVGTANSYNSNQNNRYGAKNKQSSARPYLSARKIGGYSKSGISAKSYGDYEDELPATPSGSEASDV